MNLQDTLFNWLQMKIVSTARPDDNAAVETCDFFEQILIEDHKIEDFKVLKSDTTMYYIEYLQEGVSKQKTFDREATDKLLQDINSNPKYNNQ